VPLENDRYRLVSTPLLFLEKEVYWGDIIEADQREDGLLYFRRMVEQAPLHHLQYILSEALINSVDFSLLLQAIEACEGGNEMIMGGVFRCHLPKECSLDVDARLKEFARKINEKTEDLELIYLVRRRLALRTFLTDPFPLERYGDHLTRLACQGAFSPLVGYEACVTRIFQILLRQTRSKYNPLLLDSDEQRRLQVITEVVRRMAIGEAPDPLSTWQVIALNYEALFASLSSPLENPFSVATPLKETIQERSLAHSATEDVLEQRNTSQVVFSRLQTLVLAVRQAEEKVVIFVDHFHRLLGDEEQRYTIDAASLLVPALARREIQMIGACTLAQYRAHIERFAAIEYRLQAICLPADEER
jgi:ATP-dependent Clp protease ATP-binding subunit ClpA